jgi:hypothetical protein
MYPPSHVFLFALVSAVCSVAAQPTPAKLATSARLDLIAEPGVRALASAEIPIGTGAVERMNWVPEADRARSYTVQFPVTAKMPVTVLAKARAGVPPDYREMRPLTGHSTAAHRAAKKFLHGTNLGNYLEAPPGQDWGAKYAETDFVHIKAHRALLRPV